MKICGTVLRPCGALDHLAAPVRLLVEVDIVVGDALPLQQRAARGRNRGSTSSCRSRLRPSPAVTLRYAPSSSATAPDYAPVRSARARVSTPTDAAPARFRTRAHSSAVAPVVSTSSITRSACPRRRGLRAHGKGAAHVALPRPPARICPCDGVRRRRISQSAATGGPPAAWIACASSAAWLKRR